MTGNNKGFTLIELMVASSLFIVVSLIATNLFVSSSKTQRETALNQRVHSDARIALNFMMDKARVGSIDYTFPDYAGGITNPVEILALEDEKGNKTLFASRNENDDPGVCPNNSSPCLAISIDDGLTWDSITSEGVRLDDIKFFIRPEVDPYDSFGGSFLSDIHPNVTMTLSMSAVDLPETPGNRLILQSTASSRLFKR